MEECPNCGRWKHPDGCCAYCGCRDNEYEYVERLRRSRSDYLDRMDRMNRDDRLDDCFGEADDQDYDDE